MNDTAATRIELVGNTNISSDVPICRPAIDKASGLYVVRTLDDERLAPSARRGASRSWLPGAWGDPF